jgi:hypothetical protein
MSKVSILEYFILFEVLNCKKSKGKKKQKRNVVNKLPVFRLRTKNFFFLEGHRICKPYRAYFNVKNYWKSANRSQKNSHLRKVIFYSSLSLCLTQVY